MALPPFLPLALAAMRKAHAPASEEDLKADEARREAELQLAEDKREQQLVSQIVEDAEQADYDAAPKEHGEIYATPDLRNQAYIASRAAIGGQGVGALEAAGMPRVFAPERAIAEEATLGAAIGKGLGMGLKAASGLIGRVTKKGAEQVPVYYSHLDEVVGGMKQNVGVNDVEKFFLGKGVKKGELRDLDIEGLVSSAKAQGKKSLSQDEIAEHVAKNRRQLEDVRIGAGVITEAEREMKALKSEAFKPVDDMLRLGDASGSTWANPALPPGIGHEILADPKGIANRIRGGELTHTTRVKIRAFLDDLQTRDFRSPLEPDAAMARLEAAMDMTKPGGDGNFKPFLDEARKILEDPAADLQANVYAFLAPLKSISREVENSIITHKILTEMLDSPAFKNYTKVFDETSSTLAKASGGMRRATTFEDVTLPGKFHPDGDNYQEMLVISPSRATKILRDPDVENLGRALAQHRASLRGGLRGREAFPVEELYGLQDKVAAKYPNITPPPVVKLPVSPMDPTGTARLWESALEDLSQNQYIQARYAPGGIGHFPDPDVMFHIRTTDRIDDWDRKVLYVEEIQSDWHQKGRQLGYKQSPEEVSRLNDEYKELLGKKIEARDKFDRAKEKAPGPWTSLHGASPEAQEIVRLHDEFDSISDAADEAKRVMERARNGLPSTSHAETKEWAALAVRRILRRAADEGYGVVAFTSGASAHAVSDMPKKSALMFYDEILPGVIKREAGIPKGKNLKNILLDLGEHVEPHELSLGLVDSVNLNELKTKLSAPQKLYSAIPLAVGAGAAAGAAQDEDKSLEDKRMEAIRRAMSE